MSSWIGLNFQDCRRMRIRELNFLHDHIIIVIIRVIILISFLVVILIQRVFFYKFFSEGTLIETVWSLVPAVLLIVLLLPSIKILYVVEDIKSPSVTIKVIAHQWYWRYVSPFFKNLTVNLPHRKEISCGYEYDSNIEGGRSLRLLSCSRELYVPLGVTSRLIITSTDVIHSFSLPSLGLKVDALPGRLNQLFSNPWRVGVFFGQCSEICGSNHSFIPISINFCSLGYFDKIRKSHTMNYISENILSYSLAEYNFVKVTVKAFCFLK